MKRKKNNTIKRNIQITAIIQESYGGNIKDNDNNLFLAKDSNYVLHRNNNRLMCTNWSTERDREKEKERHVITPGTQNHGEIIVFYIIFAPFEFSLYCFAHSVLKRDKGWLRHNRKEKKRERRNTRE